MTRCVLVLLALCCMVTAAEAQTEPPVVAEARAFMADYARDLTRGDREAISARYDRTGTFFLVRGGHEFVTHATLTRDYRESWSPPTSFAWRDLHFDAAGPDAVVVNGLFVWGREDRQEVMTYTGFLRRQDGQLRIRLEDESLATAVR